MLLNKYKTQKYKRLFNKYKTMFNKYTTQKYKTLFNKRKTLLKGELQCKTTQKGVREGANTSLSSLIVFF